MTHTHSPSTTYGTTTDHQHTDTHINVHHTDSDTDNQSLLQQQQQQHAQPGSKGHWSYTYTFTRFLAFGLRAFGGPATQIAMMTDVFVTQYRWIDETKFVQVMGLYNCLPGPEATEIACYFGWLASGKIGSLLAGLGFMLPGMTLMLLLSYIYVHYGITELHFAASFHALQPAVAAMFARSVHKLGSMAVIHHGQLDYWYMCIAVISALAGTVYVNFFIVLGFSLVLGVLSHAPDQQLRRYGSAAWISLAAAAFALYVSLTGHIPPQASIGVGVAREPTYTSLFMLGLVGGSLSFGGAFAAIPFMQVETTVIGHWMTKGQYLDGLALGSVLPAPLVIFSTFVGYVGGNVMSHGDVSAEITCGILTTVGMFLPALLMPTLLHEQMRKLLQITWMHSAFEGVTAAVIGLMFITALQLIQQTVGTDTDAALRAVIFICTLLVLFVVNHPYLPIMVIATAALVGQFFFTDLH